MISFDAHRLPERDLKNGASRVTDQCQVWIVGKPCVEDRGSHGVGVFAQAQEQLARGHVVLEDLAFGEAYEEPGRVNVEREAGDGAVILTEFSTP